MADQLAAGWLPPYGHGIVHAPSISALAGDGVVFEHAYCASPLCAPSRAALLTGRLPSRTGVYDNAAELRASEPTLTHRLRAAGYATCLSGKMHFVGPDQLHGYEQRLTTDVYPADLDWTPDWRVPASERLPWYHTMESVLTPGACTASMQMDYDDEVTHRAVRKLHALAREPGDRPFFLTVSLTHPHDPWELRPEYWDRYDERAIDLPAVGRIPRAEADPHSLRLRDMSAIDEADVGEEQIRARPPRLLRRDQLRRRAHRRPCSPRCRQPAWRTTRSSCSRPITASCSASAGSGTRWRSSTRPSASRSSCGCRAARPACACPSRSRCSTSCPRCSSCAGSTRPTGAGRPQPGARPAPAARIAPADVASEYLAEGVNAPAVMLRRGRHKYIRCGDDPELLFDLDADPHELDNRAAAEPDVCAALRAEADRRWDLPALHAAVLRSQDERRLVVEALRSGRPAPWSFVPAARRPAAPGRRRPLRDPAAGAARRAAVIGGAVRRARRRAGDGYGGH